MRRFNRFSRDLLVI